MSIKKIPLGLSSYSKIIQGGYYYIDKTRYIEVLENLNTNFPILLRPRRFGKTLFADMLQTYYDINQAEKFEQLFGRTYIGSHKTALANSYYVLHFNLSGLDTRDADRLEITFGAYIKEEIRNFTDYYQLNDMQLNDEEDFVTYTNSFLSRLRNRISQKLYIIIDEYDHFANALLSSTKDFTNATNKDGFVRSFYEVLKKHINYVLDRIFITGVTSLTLDSLTSGFNICKNISNDKSMNGALGFTLNEVTALADDMNLENPDRTIEILKENYNGYLFSDMTNERIFNSNMILYYIDAYMSRGAQPEQLADPNITGDYAKLSAMLDLYTDFVQKEEILQALMSNQGVIGKMMTSFSLLTKFTRDHFISLLYYLGLLTLDKGISGGSYQFKVPNYIIRDVYYDYYYTYLTDTLAITDSMISDVLVNLEERENISPLIELVEQIIDDSTRTNNRYLIHFRENTLQTLFYLILRQSNKFSAKMEYKVDNKYVDIMFSAIDGSRQYAIELKYISQARYGADQSLLDHMINEVQKQIQESSLFRDNVKGIAIIFVGKVCEYSQIMINNKD